MEKNTQTTSTNKNIEVQFEQPNRLKYQVGKVTHVMTCTKTKANKCYFGCINRFLVEPRKCGATDLYLSDSKLYTIKRPHIPSCGKDLENISVSDSYTCQKEFLIEELQKNPRLTAAEAKNLISKENITKSPSKKVIPLNYEQIKYIIECYREDNGIKNTESLNDIMVMSKDNSLFLRNNSSFYNLYQSNFSFYYKLTFY